MTALLQAYETLGVNTLDGAFATLDVEKAAYTRVKRKVGERGENTPPSPLPHMTKEEKKVLDSKQKAKKTNTPPVGGGEDGGWSGWMAKASKKQQDKVVTVMREYKAGRLKGSDGKKITSEKQAVAIAMSEAGLDKAFDSKVRDNIEEREKVIAVINTKTKKDDKKEIAHQKEKINDLKHPNYLKKAFETLGVV